MTTLEATSVTYYSRGDEDAFFAWLKSIPGVVDFQGHLRTLYIEIDDAKVVFQTHYELTGLFTRYGVDLEQLNLLPAAPLLRE